MSSGVDPAEARTFYEQVRDYLSRRSKEDLGFALDLNAVSSKDAESPEGLLETSGKAMYEARLQGLGRTFVP